MRLVDAAVDDGHAHVAPGGHGVQVVEVPLRGGGLQRVQRVEMALRAELVHGLRPRHLGMRLQRRDAGVEAGLRRQREHRAVEAQRGHGPQRDQRQPVRGRETCARALLRLRARGVGVARAAVAAVHARVRRRRAQHHQHLARRRGGVHGRGRHGRVVGAGRHASRGQREAQPEPAQDGQESHGDALSSASTSATPGALRSLSSAAA